MRHKLDATAGPRTAASVLSIAASAPPNDITAPDHVRAPNAATPPHYVASPDHVAPVDEGCTAPDDIGAPRVAAAPNHVCAPRIAPAPLPDLVGIRNQGRLLGEGV